MLSFSGWTRRLRTTDSIASGTSRCPRTSCSSGLTPEGTWIDWGRYQAAAFGRCEGGAYLNTMSGSPMWIRCLRQDGTVLYVVDGQGDPYTYRLVPFPSRAYWEPGQPRPEAEHDGLRFDEAGDPYVTWEDVERMSASLAPGETLEVPEDVRIRRAPGKG